GAFASALSSCERMELDRSLQARVTPALSCGTGMDMQPLCFAGAPGHEGEGEMTPKQKGKRKGPRAVAWQTPFRKRWMIATPDWAGRDLCDGSYPTANAAWAAAARRVRA